MKKIAVCFLTLLFLAVLDGCQKEKTPQEAASATQHWQKKILRTKAGSIESTLLVKLSNAQQVGILENHPGIVSVEPLFNSVKGKEKLEREFGLDRWFVVTKAGEVSCEGLACGLAAKDEVCSVEFNTVIEKDFGEVYPVEDAQSIYTKADASYPFNDEYLKYQWHYRNTGDKLVSNTAVEGADINVFPVWEQLCCGDKDIIVAVVDEGVCYTHEDLADNMWKNPGEIPENGKDDDGNGYVDDVYGYNFVNNGGISWTKSGDTGHGSFCAGTIAAVNNNGKGVSGVAGGSGKGDGCRIMSCQIFSGNAGGNVLQSANAIKYAADNGASVISCSFGYSVPFSSDDDYLRSIGSAELDAIRYFEATPGNNPVLTDGNIAVFSAGNETHPYSHYPGAAYDIISVSAFGPDLLPSYYTNFGPGCNIAAPGGEMGQIDTFRSLVLSTVTTETNQKFDGKEGQGFSYGYMQGTSMACPHVSGVVALALSYAKKLGKTFTRDEFKQMLLSSTNDIDQRIAAEQSKKYVNVVFDRKPDGSYKYYPAQSELSLDPYYHQMGTGAVDAWRLMMHIEGTACVPAEAGKKQWLTLDSVLGSSSVSLTYLDVEVDEATIKSLGLQKLTPKVATGANGTPVPNKECYVYEQFGRLYIHPTNVGSGTVTIKLVGGGDHIGGGSNPPGGMELTRKISIISRYGGGLNGSGGWL